MIPVEKMIVLWDTNDKEQITELAVEHSATNQSARAHF